MKTSTATLVAVAGAVGAGALLAAYVVWAQRATDTHAAAVMPTPSAEDPRAHARDAPTARNTVEEQAPAPPEPAPVPEADVAPVKVSPVILRQLLATSSDARVRQRALEGAFAQSAFAPLQQAWRALGGVEVLSAALLAPDAPLAHQALASSTLANFAHHDAAQRAMHDAHLFAHLLRVMRSALPAAVHENADAARVVAACCRILQNVAATDEGGAWLVRTHGGMLAGLSRWAASSTDLHRWATHITTMFNNLACAGTVLHELSIPDGVDKRVAGAEVRAALEQRYA